MVEHPSNAWALKKGYSPVYTASESARIVIVGQAPGRKAQESLTPWNDISGDNLRKWLGLTRQQFYDAQTISLMPMDFFYPGKAAHGDLPPRREFAPMWHPRLRSLMPHVQLTLLVGRYAQAYYLGKLNKPTLTHTVLNFNEYLPAYLPLVHPSPLNFRWRSRNPWFEKEVVPQAREMVHKILSG